MVIRNQYDVGSSTLLKHNYGNFANSLKIEFRSTYMLNALVWNSINAVSKKICIMVIASTQVFYSFL